MINRPQLIECFRTGSKDGLKKGISGYIWMMKILVPISFFTFLLDYSGWIQKADFLLAPVMGLLSLPPVAALPLLIGLLTGIYGAVAAMMVLPLTTEQMTLIAIFLLISHNLIQEGIIQGKSGMNPIAATLVRLAASVVTVVICARFLDTASPEALNGVSEFAAAAPFWTALQNWAGDTAVIVFKIFLIIMAVMWMIELFKSFGLIRHLIRVIQPLLILMGLDRRVGIMWLAASLFGIAYGGAVIVEEACENEFSGEELTKLHCSIGINHAVIEDPSLFLPLGLSPLWLWIPRALTAMLTVYILKIFFRLKRRWHVEIPSVDMAKEHQ